MRLKRYYHDCGSIGVLCYLIPLPIKRARTLVSCVMVTVISVKVLYVKTVIPVAAKIVDATLVAE